MSLRPCAVNDRAGEPGDGGRVETAAEQQAAGFRRAAQPAGHRLAQHAAIGLDVIGFVAAHMRRIGARLPVTARVEHAVQPDRHHRAPWDASDAGEDRLAVTWASIQQKRPRQCELVKRARHLGQRPQSIQFGREGDKVLALVEEQMALAHMVARQHEFAGARVPHGEHEVAEQMLDAILAPLSVGRQQQRAVGHCGERAGRNAERRGKLFAIIEPRVGGKREAGRIIERLRVEDVFVSDPHQRMAERGRSAAPGGAAVRAAMRHGGEHAIEVAPRRRAAVEPQDSADAANERCSLRAKGFRHRQPGLSHDTE